MIMACGLEEGATSIEGTQAVQPTTPMKVYQLSLGAASPQLAGGGTVRTCGTVLCTIIFVSVSILIPIHD